MKKNIVIILQIFFTCFFSVNVLLSLLVPVVPGLSASLFYFFIDYIWPIGIRNPSLLPVILEIESWVLSPRLIVSQTIPLSIFSGLILIYLIDIGGINFIIKQKIKNILNGFSSSVINSNDNFGISIPASLNIFLLLFSCLLLFVFVCIFFTITPVVHVEAIHTFTSMLNPGTVIRDFIPTVFNNYPIERHGFRPQLTKNIIEYININALPFLNRLFPFWGMRLIFNLIAAFLTVIAVYRLLNFFFKNTPLPIGLKMFLSVLPLYFANYHAYFGIFHFHRSTKFLVVPLMLFLLHYFLRNSKVCFEKKNVYKLILQVFLIAFIMLVDEQIVGIVVYLFFASVLLSYSNKRIYSNVVVFAGAIILFLVWFNVVGRYLFTLFTPIPLITHPHTYSDVFRALLPSTMIDIFAVFINLIHINFFHTLPVALLLFLTLLKDKMRFSKEIFYSSFFLFILSFLLLSANVAALPGHIVSQGMIDVHVLVSSVVLFYFSGVSLLIAIFSHSKYKLLCMILSLVFLGFSNYSSLMSEKNNLGMYGERRMSLITVPRRFVERLDAERDTFARYYDLPLMEKLIKENNIRPNHFLLIREHMIYGGADAVLRRLSEE